VIVGETVLQDAEVRQVRRPGQVREYGGRVVHLSVLLVLADLLTRSFRELVEVERVVAHVVQDLQPAQEARFGRFRQHRDERLRDRQRTDVVEPAAGELVVIRLVRAAPGADEESPGVAQPVAGVLLEKGSFALAERVAIRL
jgi:hypothetical protein